MNHQSDHGYTTGGIEHRTRELCERRANFCDALAAAHPDEADKYRRWSAAWRQEAAALDQS